MRFTGTIAALALVVASCGAPQIGTPTTPDTAPTTTVPPDDPGADLDAARQLWRESGLDTYWYRLIDDCGECDPSSRLPRTVVVWSGEATGTNQKTIESMFEEIEVAIEQGRTVEVLYDPDLGHPTDIGFDMEDRAFDGGYHLLVEDLVTGLPGDGMASEHLEEARELWESTKPEAYEFYMSIHCDCELAGTIWTRVEGDRIADWSVELSAEPDTQISPITVDIMFDDLAEMMSLAEGIVEEGVRFTGSAAYDPQYGFPMWVGLDIEILDPTSELAELPPRLVFMIEDFTPVEPSDGLESLDELEKARAVWAVAGLSDYRYDMTLHDIENASFTDPYTVTVAGGVVVRVESKGRVVDDVPAPVLSIDMVFDLLVRWIADGITVDALFHSKLGYPVFVAARDSRIPDFVQSFSIDRLTPLP